MKFLNVVYEKGVKLFGQEKKKMENRLCRSEKLPIYDIEISPKTIF